MDEVFVEKTVKGPMALRAESPSPKDGAIHPDNGHDGASTFAQRVSLDDIKSTDNTVVFYFAEREMVGKHGQKVHCEASPNDREVIVPIRSAAMAGASRIVAK
jgi:hypothetical protein